MKKGLIFKNFLILIFSIATIFTTVYGIRVGYQYFTTAKELTEPKEMKLTNLSDNSAALSWITAQETPGFVVWGRSLVSLPEFQRSEEKKKIHYFALKNLSPETTYYYKIGSGKKIYDQEGRPFSFTTASIASSPPIPDEVYGKVKTSAGEPATPVLVYLKIEDKDGQGSSGVSTTLSTLTDSAGTFALDLGNARTENLSSYFVYSRTADQITIKAQGADLGSKELLVLTSQSQPLPEIVLSPTGGRDDFSGQPLTPEQIASQETRTKPLSPEKESRFQKLLGPKISEKEIEETKKIVVPQITSFDKEATLFSGSIISGTASPSAILTITIRSKPITAQVKANENGSWSYVLPSNLSPGEHTITISDENGSDSKNFVLAAAVGGGEATQSASPSALPVTSISPPTLLLFLTGLMFLLLGAKLVPVWWPRQ